jgi:hypothetical protein
LVKYENGTLTPQDCVGREVAVKLKIETDPDGNYPPKNSVADYIVDKSGVVKKSPAVSKANDDDDVNPWG